MICVRKERSQLSEKRKPPKKSARQYEVFIVDLENIYISSISACWRCGEEEKANPTGVA